MEEWLDKVMVERACPECQGARVRATRLLFTINGRNIHELGQLHFDELQRFLATVKTTGRGADAGRQVLKDIRSRLDLLLGIGLDYLSFNRRSSTLSGGESQRIRLSSQIGSGLMGMLYVLDEPSIGLHPKDNVKMIATIERLRDIGNTVIVVEHDEDTIRAADHIVEMGPGPGVHGGRVVAQGTIADILKSKASPTGQYLSGARVDCDAGEAPQGQRQVARRPRRSREQSQVADRDVSAGAARRGDGRVRLGQEHARQRHSVQGAVEAARRHAHAAGRSRRHRRPRARAQGREHRPVADRPQQPVEPRHVHRVLRRDPRPVHGRRRSRWSATYKPGRFSFNVKGGRCEECQGEGVITTQLYFMPDVEVTCGACKGARFNSETLEVTLRGKTIDDILNMSVEEGVTFFAADPSIGRKIQVLADLGLGYLTLGQSATTLSGGEAQRIKIATELSTLQRAKHTVYILDEPTTGLHLADIERLLESLNKLVDAGHTVILIEHHLDVIKTADHVIDLGPDGGHAGGEVVATGTPEAIARCKASHTGRFLKAHLAG